MSVNAVPTDELRRTAEFLLWQHDRGGPVAESNEAWEALRRAISNTPPASAKNETGIEPGVEVSDAMVKRLRVAYVKATGSTMWPTDEVFRFMLMEALQNG